MTRQTILDRLKSEAPELRRKYALESLAVFGSIARDDGGEGSDVDVLVEFAGPATFSNFMGLKIDLEDLFGRSVDLLTPKSLSPVMRSEIEKEAIPVPNLDPRHTFRYC